MGMQHLFSKFYETVNSLIDQSDNYRQVAKLYHNGPLQLFVLAGT